MQRLPGLHEISVGVSPEFAKHA